MCNKIKKKDKNSRDYSDTLKAVYQILYCKQKFPAMVNLSALQTSSNGPPVTLAWRAVNDPP